MSRRDGACTVSTDPPPDVSSRSALRDLIDDVIDYFH
jgi:hypothetical protein